MDQTTHNKIVSFIWGIADDVLRDLFKRGKYPDVILPMCVLRRLDAVLEPTKKAVLETKEMLDNLGMTEQRVALCEAAKQSFCNTSKFTLKDLMSRASQQQLRQDFEMYLDGFSSNVQDILENFKFRNQIPTLSKADAIGALIEKFLDPDINLSPNPVLNGDGSIKHPAMDNHSMGTVFEELVRKFNEDNNEEAGEHWTPRDAVKLMANLIFLPVADSIKSGSYLLYDGACGTGGMLTVAEKTLKQLASERGNTVKTHLYGQEINPETYAICKAEMLFKFGRCMVHFAMDDQQVKMCTELKGKASWFLPFNQGWNDGAGNLPNPYGIKTDYLWKRLLTPYGLTNIIENYAQIVKEKDPKTGRKKSKQIFPRFHQLEVVPRLLADAAWYGAGGRYLIQHSTGSGKSNSIAWLAHQLIGIRENGREVFDSIIVITDRRILDDQIKNNVKQFAQVGATVGHARQSRDLRKYIEGGKKIIISTVQKFPEILDEIGDQHRGRTFAIIIDEAHSSQGGKTSAAMSEALYDPEDTVNDALQKRMDARKMLTNASYFAFTATPKNKTLEMFGKPCPGPDGKVKHLPFHSYTMKQAIQEGFILDVLKSYTPVDSYYKLVKTVEDDPEFDTKKAQKKLRRYVEGHEQAIRLKSEIMVDHFHAQVLGRRKIGGQARAMIVCSGVERAIRYFESVQQYLEERKSPYRAIVAFSGEHAYGGAKVTEASLNKFSGDDIADRIQQDPYRFLICADKFQTGYDEPLLHTMYVDKPLAGIKAVQTLSRLNRAHPQKHDVFVLDFMNNTETIKHAFSDYYRTTVLSEETDPNKLHDLKNALDRHQVYTREQVEALVAFYLEGEAREKLDPILDACVALYIEHLDENEQVDFKGKAKAFTRTYDFLASVLPYNNAEWETLSIFLTFLVPKLPAPKEEDLSKGILETIDMDSYRVEKRAAMKIVLEDKDAEIYPIPIDGRGWIVDPKMDYLSNILKSFNEQFGTLFTDADRVSKRITEDIAPKVAADEGYQNAKKNTPQTARIEHDRVLEGVIVSLLKDDTELFKQFFQNESFRRFVTDMVFNLTAGFGGENPEAGRLQV